MIIVTGGAGFIGSNLVATLMERGYPQVMVCDRFGTDQKWKNLAKHPIFGHIPPEELFDWLDSRGPVQAIFHMGAISSTTETDVDKLLKENLHFSRKLWLWCAENRVPFLYASSAATYGNGNQGYEDDDSLDYLTRLQPLNPYGWSKHLFDLRVARAVAGDEQNPPHWAGFKFFNVYGPNEYHKGNQCSVVCAKFPEVQAGNPVRLFKSYREDFSDGEQKRDFVHVQDCCDIMLWFLEHPEHNGIYNVGTGQAASFNTLGNAMLNAMGRNAADIQYINMPENLQAQYQYFTEASLAKLRAIGYDVPFISLEDGVKDYVTRHLNTEDPYR
ncbi:MAG: ADP-glyceromanno-heptose 6-epimerase [Rickettsiales bacterium]|nr:ADP-glyceromanno-heptose 6-epimerase [Rickettsiales bacterium]